MSYCLADVVEMHGDVGLSGGYGLWGPATGPVIYPDLHPTYDQFPQNNVGETVIGQSVISDTSTSGGTVIQGPELAEPEMVLPNNGVAPSVPSGTDLLPDGGLPIPAPMPEPRAGSLPASGRRVTTSPVPTRTASPASARMQTSNPPGRFVRSADFKFVDQEAAAALSGIAQEPVSKP